MMKQERVNQILRELRNIETINHEVLRENYRETLRQELIQGHISFAYAIAHRVARFRHHLRQDLEGEAQLELVEVINEVCNGEKEMYDNELAKVLNKNISHRCKDYIENNGYAIAMSGRTYRFRLRHGLNDKGASEELIKSDLPLEKKEQINLLPHIYQDGMIEKAKKIKLEELKQLVREELAKLLPIPKVNVAFEDYPSTDDEVEFLQEPSRKHIYGVYFHKVPYSVPVAKREVWPEIKELLNKAAISPIEEKIIEMRSQGFTYQEIAPKVGMGIANVSKCMQRIEERFDYYAQR